MNKSLILTAATVAALATGVAGAQVYSAYPAYGYDTNQARVVRCESIGSRTNFCRVDTRGGVQLSRQLSQQACLQGRNWRATSEGITVTDGCRAEFVVNAGYGSTAYYGNTGYGSTAYYGNTGYARDGYRTRNYTTDRYGRRVYVTGYSQTGYYGNDGNTIHCQSNGHGRTYCGVRGSHYSMVDRSPSCILDRSWGNDGYGTWVSGNCNADFTLQSYPVDQAYDPTDEVYERNRETTPYNYTQSYPNTYMSGQDSYGSGGSDVIYCRSGVSGRTYCGDSTRAYTLRYSTNSGCVLGSTYGTDSYGTWVAGRCNLTLEPRY